MSIKKVLDDLNNRLRDHPNKFTVTEMAATWMPMLRKALKEDENKSPRNKVKKIVINPHYCSREEYQELKDYLDKHTWDWSEEIQ